MLDRDTPNRDDRDVHHLADAPEALEPDDWIGALFGGCREHGPEAYQVRASPSRVTGLLEIVGGDAEAHAADDPPRVLDVEVVLPEVEPVGVGEPRDVRAVVDDERDPRAPTALGDGAREAEERTICHGRLHPKLQGAAATCEDRVDDLDGGPPAADLRIDDRVDAPKRRGHDRSIGAGVQRDDLSAVDEGDREAGMMVVVVGSFAPERTDEIRLSIMRAQMEPLFCSDPERARAALSERPAPKCIVVDGRSAGLEAFVAWVRGEARLFAVPIVVVVPSLDEDAFSEAHASGADDVVVARDDDAITRRLVHLAEYDPAARPAITQGRAVVGHAEMGRRRVLGRILRQAGFDVAFAASEDEVVAVSRGPFAPTLLVLSDALAGGVELGTIEAVRRETAPDVPAVVLGPARDLRDLGRAADRKGAVVITSDLAPPDNLLFLANELLRPGIANVRASARLLHGALCGYREAGSLVPAWGVTYNISREGLYVRTLDPPSAGAEVWLELRPPRSTRAVQLSATVVWRRGVTSGAGGASPPGFGARILPESCSLPSLNAYHEGYERLRTEPRVFG